VARRRLRLHALDILVQSRRNAGAAKRFFKRLLKGLRVLITDKLGSGLQSLARGDMCPDGSAMTSYFTALSQNATLTG
jgi:transposase-like protein